MRPIKFRAWDEERKVMYLPNTKLEVGEIHLKSGLISVYDWDDNFEPELPGIQLRPYSNIELMQFTGLKDKNGKVDAYEKDVVKYSSWKIGSSFDTEGNKKIGVIEFVDSAWHVVDAKGEKITIFPLQTGNNFEIIGNIYESPDLLKTN